MQSGKKQYGLQLQIKGPAKKPTARPAPTSAFRFNDDEDDDVEAEIARQANKKRNVRPEVEQQLKKALAEDPNAFDYDGVYEDMKGSQARQIQEDRVKREPKYIGKLLEKAKVRAREQDIVYERQLAKEREKEDHLYGDKEKFVTGAYKKKLQEQAKWLEEERRRELEEQKHQVGDKSDMSDFYRNLLKNNVAFGARNAPSEKRIEEKGSEEPESQLENEVKPSTSSRDHEKPPNEEDNRSSKERIDSSRDDSKDDGKKVDDQEAYVKEKPAEKVAEEKPAVVVDPVAAARERYLARKRQRGL